MKPADHEPILLKKTSSASNIIAALCLVLPGILIAAQVCGSSTSWPDIDLPSMVCQQIQMSFGNQSFLSQDCSPWATGIILVGIVVLATFAGWQSIVSVRKFYGPFLHEPVHRLAFRLVGIASSEIEIQPTFVKITRRLTYFQWVFPLLAPLAVLAIFPLAVSMLIQPLYFRAPLWFLAWIGLLGSVGDLAWFLQTVRIRQRATYLDCGEHLEIWPNADHLPSPK